MGVLVNITIYGLMIAPVAMMLRGHHIAVSRHILLATVIAVLQLVFSMMLGCVAYMPWLTLLTNAMVIPILQATFMHFLLNNSKAARVFRLDEYTHEDDGANSVSNSSNSARSHTTNDVEEKDTAHPQGGSAAAALSTIYVVVDIILVRWFPWYRALSSLSFIYDNMASAAECFLLLITLLAACRILCRGSEASVSGVVAVHAAGVMLAELPMLQSHARLARAAVTAVGMTAMRALTRRRVAFSGPVDATALKKRA